jgi:hypothetical protein
MFRVINGVYRLDGELDNKVKPSLIVVHPYWNADQNSFRLYGGRGNYLENLAALLADSFNRDIFLFEEDCSWYKINRQIVELRGNESGFYVIPTIPGSPKPFYSNWEDIIKFLASFGEKSEICGGYFYREGKIFEGCAGYTFQKLRDFGLKPKAIKNCLFT